MGGMDFIGPISPHYTITGAIYVLVYVNYFTRFVWAKAYARASGDEVIDIFENYLTPIFGWPEGIYSDNGLYFVNEQVRTIFSRYGVTYFTGPIIYPSSTGLLERAV